jgi:hypothetical protein
MADHNTPPLAHYGITMHSEVFVMILFICGLPVFYLILKDATLSEHKLFLGAYSILTLSNICSVVEEFLWNTLFNIGEHVCITVASLLLFTAVIRMTSLRKQHHKENNPSGPLPGN